MREPERQGGPRDLIVVGVRKKFSVGRPCGGNEDAEGTTPPRWFRWSTTGGLTVLVVGIISLLRTNTSRHASRTLISSSKRFHGALDPYLEGSLPFWCCRQGSISTLSSTRPADPDSCPSREKGHCVFSLGCPRHNVVLLGLEGVCGTDTRPSEALGLCPPYVAVHSWLASVLP